MEEFFTSYQHSSEFLSGIIQALTALATTCAALYLGLKNRKSKIDAKMISDPEGSRKIIIRLILKQNSLPVTVPVSIIIDAYHRPLFSFKKFLCSIKNSLELDAIFQYQYGIPAISLCKNRYYDFEICTFDDLLTQLSNHKKFNLSFISFWFSDKYNSSFKVKLSNYLKQNLKQELSKKKSENKTKISMP